MFVRTYTYVEPGGKWIQRILGPEDSIADLSDFFEVLFLMFTLIFLLVYLLEINNLVSEYLAWL